MTNNFLKIICIIALLTIVSTNVAFAAVDSYVELAPLPGACTNVTVGGVTTCVVKVGTGNSLGQYINTLYKLAVASASVLAVLMILVGGFKYVSSDAIGNKEEGKETIKAALGGMLLILASWVILNTINPQLVSLKIASTPLESRNLFDRLYMNQEVQKKIDALYAKVLADDMIAKKDARGLQSTAGDILTLVSNERGVLEKYYEGTLTDEEKMAYFGTKDESAIATAVKTLTNSLATKEILSKYYEGTLTSAEMQTYFGTTNEIAVANKVRELTAGYTEKNKDSEKKAQALIQEAEIIETVDRAQGGITHTKTVLLSLEDASPKAKVEGEIQTLTWNYNVAIQKISAQILATPANITAAKDRLKNQTNVLITALCNKLSYQIMGAGFGGNVSTTNVDNGAIKCKGDNVLK